jgi:hypothetical protein
VNDVNGSVNELDTMQHNLTAVQTPL